MGRSMRQRSLAGRLVEGDDVAVAVLVAVDDDRVLVEHRRRAEAVDRRRTGPATSARPRCRRSRSRRRLHGPCGRWVEEGDEDVLAVGRRRGAGVAVEVVQLLQRGGDDLLLPEDRCRRARSRHRSTRALSSVLRVVSRQVVRKTRSPQTMGDEWPLPGMASSRRRSRSPLHLMRHVLLVGGAVAVRPAPAGPVAARRACEHDQGRKRPGSNRFMREVPQRTVGTSGGGRKGGRRAASRE